MIHNLLFSRKRLYVIITNSTKPLGTNVGRKSKYDTPMTSAEKSRAYRLKKQREGKKMLTITITSSVLERIDEMVDFYCLPNRATVIEDLLALPLVQAIEIMIETKSEGAEEHKYLDELPDDHKAQGVIGEVKRNLWKALTLGTPSELKQISKSLQEKVDNPKKASQQ